MTVEAANDTAESDLVHWHGFHIPPAVPAVRLKGI